MMIFYVWIPMEPMDRGSNLLKVGVWKEQPQLVTVAHENINIYIRYTQLYTYIASGNLT